MQTRYKVRVFDHAFNLQLEFDHFESLIIEEKVNAPGTFQLNVEAGHPVLDYLLDRDTPFEFWRSVKDEGLDWYKEFCGFARTRVDQTFTTGKETLAIYGVGYLDLIARRTILYPADSTQCTKEGVAETVIKEFVTENAGTGANHADRYEDGVTIGLYIEADLARGNAWNGSRSHQNLLSVIQNVSDTMFFDVIGIGNAEFIFKVFPNVRGLDRRSIGINQTTGLNAAGNSAVVFALGMGNMGDAVLSRNVHDEATSVIALGQGEGDAREWKLAEDTALAALSPWNKREAVINASREDGDGLQQVADDELIKRAMRTSFNFSVIQTPASFYGQHYHFGDWITGRYRDYEEHLYILGASLNVGEKGEIVKLTIGSDPTAVSPSDSRSGITEISLVRAALQKLIEKIAAMSQAQYLDMDTAVLLLDTPQSIPDATDTPISWTSIEAGPSIYWNPLTPTKIHFGRKRFKLRMGFFGAFNWASNATGMREIRVNTYTEAGVLRSTRKVSSEPANGSDEHVQSFMIPYTVTDPGDVSDLSTGDYVTVSVKQNRGGALNMLQANLGAFLIK